MQVVIQEYSEELLASLIEDDIITCEELMNSDLNEINDILNSFEYGNSSIKYSLWSNIISYIESNQP
jgi:hypothetical protein